ncbi:uncharacterized protein LOC118187092 [Stegodyphus dumicola]|uniref:uncharacterized protein LOC118187092 n=1 Tax=Stegodyphus dumicola TaxID=202533 RepID=UPI0015AC87BC|nr:uncharacterized protein LOC118187092 [Stegodyphus dumicola]
MELTWNKLLLLLGLLSSAASESNSHKFPTDIYEYGFESQRMDVSQSSAKLPLETRKVSTSLSAERSQSLPETLVSETLRAKEVEQASKFIKRMFIDESEEEEDDQPSKSIKDVFKEEDESQLRVSDDNEEAMEITPEDLHYDSQRIQNIPKSEFLNKNAGIYKTYSNLHSEKYDNVWLASEKQQEKITSPKEVSADEEANAKQVANKQETDGKIKDTTKNNKTKRRKVLRVKKRPGFKNKNNQTKPESKILKEQNQTNMNINMERKDKEENRLKSDRPILNFLKSHQPIEKETLPETNLSAELPNTTIKVKRLEKESAIDFHSELGNKQQTHREINSPEQSTSKERKDYVVTFLRRIGEKLLSDYKPVKQSSKPEWVSMYKTEDGEANNNYYVQSFNYRGDQNKEAKDMIKLIQWTSLRNEPQKKVFDSSEKKTPFQKNRNFQTHDARSYSSEKILRSNSETGKSPVKWNKVTNYKLLEAGKKDLEGIHEKQMEKKIVRKVFPENDRAKLDVASISFKKKSTSQNRKPHWQPGEPVHISGLKPLKKKIQYDENVSERENYEDPYLDNQESDNNSFLQNKEESLLLKSKNGEPAFSHYDQNLKSITRKSAPSYSTGNENGKYFVHVFRRMGEVSKEDFDINSDEIPEGDGYVSSMKLSWDEDDTNAQIERAIDSWPKVSKTFTREKDFFTRVDESIKTLEDANEKARGGSSSTEDDEYHSENEEYTYRKKRSTEKTHDPYIKTHFTMGKSKTSFQSTLSSNQTNPIFLDKHQKPVAGSRLSGNAAHITPAQTHYRNAARQSELNDDKGRNAGNFRTYYHKPEYEKKMRKLAKEFHIKKSTEASPFDEYAKPVRELKNYQIFHSYKEPKRDQKPKSQIETFYNVKNIDTKQDRRIFDKTNMKSLQRLKPSYSNLQRNNNGHQRLTDNTETEVVQSSADINKFFFKKGESSKETRDAKSKGTFNKPNERKTLAEMSSDKILMEANTNEPVIKTFFRKSGQAAIPDGKKSFSEYDGTRNKQSDMEKLNDEEEHDEYTAENADAESDSRYSPNDGILLPHDDQNDFPKNSITYRKESKAKPVFRFESDDWKHSFSSPEEPEYPRLHSIPKTHFTCKEKSTGYYADPETGCQVFHMCQATGEKHSFLCPNTTVFNQKLLVCDWYSKVKCEKSELFYSINDHIYQQNPSNNEMTSARHPDENSWNWKLRQLEAEVEKTFSANKGKLPKEEDLQTDDANIQSSPYLKHADLNHNKTTNSPSKRTEYKSSARKSYNKDYGIREATRKYNKPSRNRGNKDNLGKEKPLKSRGYDYHKDNEYVHLHKNAERENSADNLSTGKPNSDANEYRTIKNSWDEKEIQKTTQPEPNSTPESIQNTYDDISSKYVNSAVGNPAFQSENSFHSENNFKSNDKEYASAISKQVNNPQKEKNNIILVHKAHHHVDNDSAESREFLDRKPVWDKKVISESASQRAQRPNNEPPEYYVRKKYLKTNNSKDETVNEQAVSDNDDNPQQNKMYLDDYLDYSDVYRNGENTPHEENKKITYPKNDQRIPRYIYPLPGIIQNDDGSREYNYGFRVEDPQKINLQGARIFKISFHDPNTKIKIGKQTDYSQPTIELHKELLNNDKDFHKNIRVYNLTTRSFPDETQKIYLAPFSFERQSGKNAQVKTHNKFVEQKSLIKPPKIIPSAIQNYDAEIKTKTSMKNIVFDKNFRNAQLTPYGGSPKQTNYNIITENPDVPTVDVKADSNKHLYTRPKPVMLTHNEKTNLSKSSEGELAYGVVVKTRPVNQNFEILGNTDKAKSLLLKYKQASQFSDLNSEKPSLRSYGYTVQMGPFRKVKVPRFENELQIEEDIHSQAAIKPFSSNTEVLNTEKINHIPLSLDKTIFQKNSKPFIESVFPGPTSARNNQDQIIKLIPLTKDIQEPILEKKKSDNSQQHHQDRLQRIPELQYNKKNNAHKMYYKIPSAQEVRKEKFENSGTPQRPQNFAIGVQPSINSKYVFTDGAKLHKETGYSMNPTSENHSTTDSIKQQPPLKNDESFECDDESESSQNTFNPKNLQLGKNGPAHKIITNAPSFNNNVRKHVEVTLKGNRKFYDETTVHHDETDNSASRCSYHSSSKESNIEIPEPNYSNAKEKFIAKLLKPKVQNTPKPDGYSKQNEKLKYPLFPITQAPKMEKAQQYEVPLQKRPIKLFDLPRASHPAAVKYYPVKKTTLNDDQILEKKLYNDEIRTTDAMPYTSSISNTREAKSSEESRSASSSDNKWEGKSFDESFDIKDQKSSDRSKRVAEDRYSKYAELERAAELEAERMIKSKRRNVNK